MKTIKINVEIEKEEELLKILQGLSFVEIIAGETQDIDLPFSGDISEANMSCSLTPPQT